MTGSNILPDDIPLPQSTDMPELRLDLDIVESNARSMARAIADLGKQWRPHVKAHSDPRLASWLIELGAIGVTAARVAEVSSMAAAGIPSVLLAHICVSDSERRQLAAAARKTNVILCADHFVQLELYSQTAAAHGAHFDILIDVNVGMNRTGCRPRTDATQLALAAERLPGLTVAGLFGYEGHLLNIDSETEKQGRIFDAMNTLQQTSQSLQQAGVACPIISAGASGSLHITGQHPVVTELQAGGGIFGDPYYIRCGLTGVQPALSVVADVVSRPALDRAVLNAGRKAINPYVEPASVIGHPEAEVLQMNAEHTVLKLSGTARDLKIGDQVSLTVGYSDHSLLMHRTVHIMRGGQHTDTWDICR
ncbi:MAG: alanine racemase [Planctomycetaceae bacterium]|nr:alanine racemase [Planctomycetaceae bacterium]